MRHCAQWRLPEGACQFGNILDIWGCASAAQQGLNILGTYESRVEASHQWPLQPSGFCYTHQQACPYARPTTAATVRIQGPPCPDYSAAGRRQGVSGPTFATLLAAGAKCRLTSPCLAVVENVPGLPTQVVKEVYGSGYRCVRADLCPGDAGFKAVSRPRTALPDCVTLFGGGSSVVHADYHDVDCTIPVCMAVAQIVL